jgi:arylsulfatase
MNGLAGQRMEGNGFPAIFNIEADPREEVNVFGTSAWVLGPYLKLVAEYQKSLQEYPNPEPVNLTRFPE